MRFVLVPRRHAQPLAPGEILPTPDARSATAVRERRELAVRLPQRFPQVSVFGFEGRDSLIIELPDGDEAVLDAIRREFDVATGPFGNKPGEPVERDMEPGAEAVAEAHARKEYRPTAVGLLRDPQGRILFVQSRHDAAEWMYVQGGIEPGESPDDALRREIAEEIGAKAASHSMVGRFLGAWDLDAEEGRTDKRGFTRGKRYFAFEVGYRGPETLALDRKELSGSIWMPPVLGDQRLLQLLEGMRAGKRALNIAMLVRLIAG